MFSAKKSLLLQIVFLVLMVALVVSGCSNGNNGSGAVAPEATSTPNEQASETPNAAVEPPIINIKWMVRHGVVKDNSMTELYLEEKFRVNIDPIITASENVNDYKQRQQVMMGTGDVPDVIYINDPAELKTFAEQGLLLELDTAQIAKLAPTVKKTMDEFAPQGWFYSEHAGKNYGVPMPFFKGQYALKSAWRTDLLTKAGIDKQPTTIEEFETTFAALKKINIFGISADYTRHFDQFNSIFGAYGVQPLQWMNKNGEIVIGATQPEAKKLADWYSKGYIHPEFVTGKDLRAKFYNGEFAYLDWVGIAVLNPWRNELAKVNANAIMDLGTPPQGPGGQGSWSWGTAGHIIAFGHHLKNDPAKLERVLSIIEAGYTDKEIYEKLFWGTEGKEFTFNDPAKKFVGGVKYSEAKTTVLGIEVPGDTNNFISTSNPIFLDEYLPEAERIIYEHANFPMSDVFGKPDVLPSAGKYWGDLTKLQMKAFTEIIRGDKPISAFDDFVKEWNKLGGEQLHKEANELYNAVLK